MTTELRKTSRNSVQVATSALVRKVVTYGLLQELEDEQQHDQLDRRYLAELSLTSP